MPTVLALETSCDESAAAVLRQEGDQLTVLSHGIASQVEEHAQWGGVVPEIASRRHVEALPNLVEHALKDAGLVAADLDAIAATVAPGLVGALMVGSITGRTLAALHQKPFLAVHHLEAHLASVFLADHPPHAPYLVLLVSGGHTELIRVDEVGAMERLGRSHDDAAGEAFDKVARLMGLGYPGGPAIQAIAVEGDAKRFRLPKGRVSKPGGGFYPYDFSFSGLKTAVLRHVEALRRESEDLPLADLAASFEQIVADVLVERSLRCCQEQGIDHLVMVGGVAANHRLRSQMQAVGQSKGVSVHIAPLAYCTDNAAMVAVAALRRLSNGVQPSSLELGVAARWPLEQALSLYGSKPPF
ncbi:MAG: tRNA (adenosine(37)-N6)-threonylcarbamoyltransferase complex transferase subunit TsaD [Cyanobacteria bacterium]|jgi:N6-L-threonylcarbamoyladenine synthase|uniref:tRNA (adenosine(37)-N6)-threonylcarbamoyltransferase complex transferase subunit TsaD n=1 Tax=Synechococcus sp. MVIR-18-1 TaxID=1386941 RepID=UPI0016459FDC|nr:MULTISPECIES: tRNA (adenosine(37)-N6)-threonylcarbamoyltransferase complex transferase subunit TsaD [unclassified Synechococcus]MCH9772889.1 tRNA (adenosine(37)-N6)-threonylcarbamoyltransferase complex transferase subunit TsaD [Cyanobacteriota bacterium]MDA9148966.1 tRNA (adenosine(37)-N6)-threonylcarbamoyltransferase complex transferase subunit TsaD [Synechococcus sp. AH-229-G18]MDB4590031.1 tRNA (adenosine(37)-N6)-threonylcarbamoyltransferase complex transferase subunit TsaD [bacterium]MDB|tara:strand:+ start:120 stop:1190 length:1071 start_codon:yes stop_codon:yes gene_type:complete